MAAQVSIDALSLNFYDATYFPSSSNSNLTIAVIGGVHGNESEGVRGVTLLRDYFKKSALSPLAQEILKFANLVIVPCINNVGFSALARSCPCVDAKVLVNSQNLAAIVADDEKGTSKVPAGWKDPNRGWEENTTLVRFNIERLIKQFNINYFVFNHDWAVKQAICKAYDYHEENKLADQVSDCVKQIFTQYYPAKKIFGDAWEFIVKASEKEDGNILLYHILKRFNIPSFLIETYLYLPASGEIHVKVTLYLLYKIACKASSLDEKTVMAQILKM